MKKIISVMVFLTMSGAVHAYSIKDKTISENGKSPRYSIEAKYPVVKGLSNKSAQDALNDSLAKWTLTKITQYRVNLDQLASPDMPSNIPGDNRISITYALKVKTDHLLGISWDVYQEFVGAAHPTETLNPAMYNLDTGAQIMLADLFVPGSNYLKRLSQYCIAQLTRSFANSGFPLFADGLAPASKNFENFLIRPEGLYFVFNPYQVAPYSAGAQEIVIPYSILADILRPEWHVTEILVR